MKRRLTIIIIAFCVSFGSMVALSLFSMQRFMIFSKYASQADHTSYVILGICSAEISLRDIGLTERGYMITSDTMYLRYLNNSIDSLNKAIAVIKDLTEGNPEQQKNVTLLKGAVALRIAALRENIAYVDSAHIYQGSRLYDDSRELMIECSRRLRQMRNQENKLLAEHFQGEKIYQKLTNDTLRYMLIIFCLVTLFLFIVMVKELRSRLLFQEELQAKIIDQKRSHNELQEIAYAASHDLQEPLRKIQVFSNMLLYQKKNNEEECRATLTRINSAANRMQQLITDLMNLTNLANTDEIKSPVDLFRVFQSVQGELHAKITEKKASVELNPMPAVKGYERQLIILFKAILDNSLKFTRDGVNPVITVSCEVVYGHELADIDPNLINKKYYRITCSDNGIGFDNRFISKIFRIFQQLHSADSDYEGKGIGLAICQRIMANHEGYLIAHGEPQMGAQFKLFFPSEA